MLLKALLNYNALETWESVQRVYLLGNEKALEDKIVDNCKENDDTADVRAKLQKIR